MKPVPFTVAALVVALFFVVLPPSAVAAVERYAVVIGHNRGSPGETDLRYAEDDAAKIYEILEELGGFGPENMVLLRGADANAIRRALITVNDRVRASVARSGAPVILLVYYSGHADAASLHLGPTSLDLAEIEQLVRGSAATFRLLIVDACRSGSLTRVKGGISAPPLFVRVEDRYAGEGAVFLTSSTANEEAQESDEIKGSFFTHYLSSGLRGAADANGDSDVALEEVYRFAYEHTVRASSRTLVGIQHPTFRYDLRGQGQLVLTRLGGPPHARAALEFPADRTYLVLRKDHEGAVVAEVGARDATRRIVLRPGRYFIRGRARRFLLEGEVAVGAGETRAVADETLERIEYARLVRKGGALGAVQGFSAGYRFRTPLWSGASLCQGGFAGYMVDMASFSVGGRIGGCRGGFSNEFLHANTDEYDLEIRLARVWDLSIVTMEATVATGVAWLRQTFSGERQAPTRNSVSGQLGLGAGISRDLGAGFYAFLDATGQVYFFPSAANNDAAATTASLNASFDAALALRVGTGLGRRW